MEIETNVLIPQPAETVWALLADFGAIAHWWPKEGGIVIDHVECEGEGVDMVRHIYNFGLNTPVSERLDFIDNASMTLILSIVGDRPKGIYAYVAKATVSAINESQCRIDYIAYISTAPGNEAKIEKNIRYTWDRMFLGLSLEN